MDRVKSFKKLIGSEPYDYQKRVWDKIDRMAGEEESSVLKIVAPTAGGKTEAALFGLLQAYASGGKPFASITYVLPNKSLVNAQKQRISRLFSLLLEAQGWEREKAKEFAEEQVTIDYGSIAEKPLYSGFVNITTWDSFVYSLGARRVVSKRFTMPASIVSTSLVVFDEVQMLQDEFAYLPKMFGNVIRHVSQKLGAPVIIMSATIPSKFEELMFEEIREAVSEESPKNSDKKKPERGRIKVELKEYDPKKMKKENDRKALVKEIIKEANEQEGTILCVFNTVERAVSFYEEAKSLVQEEPLLIHGRFVQEDRKKKEGLLEEASLIVATQVVEAGLDLPNVSLVVTENCPADALIQRIGRCARKAGTKGRAIILNHSEDVPYPKGLVNRLSEGDKERIEKALHDNKTAQEFIDKNYKDYLKEEDSKKQNPYHDSERYFKNSKEYLEKLMLLSSPPTALPYRARLGYYVTLVPEDLLSEEEGTVPPENVLKHGLSYPMGSLYVSGHKADSLRKIITGSLAYKRQDGRTVYVREKFKRFIEEGEVYVIKKGSYDKETGLRV